MDGLRRLWQSWKRIAQLIGDVIARVVLTVFYFTIFVPFGIVVRLVSDPLMIKGNSPPRWSERSMADPSLDDARRLF
jgi:hypothetical protein